MNEFLQYLLLLTRRNELEWNPGIYEGFHCECCGHKIGLTALDEYRGSCVHVDGDQYRIAIDDGSFLSFRNLWTFVKPCRWTGEKGGNELIMKNIIENYIKRLRQFTSPDGAKVHP